MCLSLPDSLTDSLTDCLHGLVDSLLVLTDSLVLTGSLTDSLVLTGSLYVLRHVLEQQGINLTFSERLRRQLFPEFPIPQRQEVVTITSFRLVERRQTQPSMLIH